ncbi:MAG: glycoside hydrolase family 32 protein [Anaerolineales bacterium]
MTDTFRPQYHFTPPNMWMNDPNGCVFYNGEYHLFYQHHPESTLWGPMHWGHAVSRDLVDWKHLPIALYPDESGMIFSGSAIVDWNNTAGFGKEALVAIFTYNKDYKESQNLAYSTDNGRTWTKYANNPIVPAPVPPADFRDPKVIRYHDYWVMLLAAGNKVVFYVSADLKLWKQSGSFGNGYGSTDGVWETPDLFQLPVEGTDETRWVLTVGVGAGHIAGGSGTQYFIGDFDGKTFTSENPEDTVLWADFGADYYAPQSWSDEPNQRRLMIGWMNNWQYARLVPTDDWNGAFSVIRELSLRRTADGIRLIHKPISELQSLREEHQHWQEQVIQSNTNLLAGVQGRALEIIAEFKITDTTEDFGFRLRVGENEHTDIRYSVKEKRLSLDRRNSGQVDFHEDFPKTHSAALSPIENTIRLHIFVDNCSVEVFANDGLTVITDQIFPDEASQGLEIFTEGEVILHSLDIFHLHPATFEEHQS